MEGTERTTRRDFLKMGLAAGAVGGYTAGGCATPGYSPSEEKHPELYPLDMSSVRTTRLRVRRGTQGLVKHEYLAKDGNTYMLYDFRGEGNREGTLDKVTGTCLHCIKESKEGLRVQHRRDQIENFIEVFNAIRARRG